MDELKTLIIRLSKLDVNIKVSGNVPWIYINEINGVPVKEIGNGGNHGFTIAWYVKDGIKLADTKEVFKLLRKYIKP